MSDEELVKAVGWGDCVRTDDGYYCESWRRKATYCNGQEDAIDFSPTSGDGYVAGFSDGYDQGREQGDNDARAILTDLIAELRRTTKGYLSPRAYAITVEQQREMADAAEARLREAMRNDE